MVFHFLTPRDPPSHRTVHLPNELWLQIGSHLSEQDRLRTMAVNRPLYALALPEVYREVKLHSADKRSLDKLNALRHDSLAEYVRSLHIVFAEPSPLRVLQNLVLPFQRRVPSPLPQQQQQQPPSRERLTHIPSKRFLSLLRDLIPRLTSLQSLHLDFASPKSNLFTTRTDFPSFMDTLFAHLSSSLTSLHVHCQLSTQMYPVLSSALKHPFPALKRLNFHFGRSGRDMRLQDLTFGSYYAFMNIVEPNLKSFTFFSPCQCARSSGVVGLHEVQEWLNGMPPKRPILNPSDEHPTLDF